MAACANPQYAWYSLIGEFVVDKLPFTPARTDAGGLVGRFSTSIWSALQIASKQNSPFLQAAVVAGTSALISTNMMYRLRKALGETLHIPDPIIALLEDACVLRLIMHIRSSWGASACR